MVQGFTPHLRGLADTYEGGTGKSPCNYSKHQPSGCISHWQGNFRPTASFDLTPAMTTNWRHLMAVSGGGVTTFYLDAVKMGTSDRQTGNNIYAVGVTLMEHRNLPNIWTTFGYIPRSWGRQMLKFFTMMVTATLVRLPIL